MKFKELKTKHQAELKKMLPELREKLRDLRFKTASNQLKNIREVRVAKKTIAKILTLLSSADVNVAKKEAEAVKQS